MKQNLFSLIWHFLFGYRYYAVISYRVGNMKLGLMQHICQSKEEARRLLIDNHSYREYKIVSFRTHEPFMPDDTEQ